MKENHKNKTLVVITGPTAVGKTHTSIEVARALGTTIISADARQFYEEIQIGTAAPTPEEMKQVKHHLAGHLSIFDYYNVSLFEKQALDLLAGLFVNHDYVVVSGGSGLYIDALCEGIDDFPDIDPQVRKRVQQEYVEKGLEGLRSWLKMIDPAYFQEVDIANPNRMMRGIEIFLQTGNRFSQLRKRATIQRPFAIKKVILNRPRQELFHRINQRTGVMLQEGIVEEALAFFRYRHLNALNTVGYKELFDWLANRTSLHQAVENIRTNTRRYAKRQLTWFKKYHDAKWFLPHETNAILRYIKE